MESNRVEMFSDGVFAIIITIMVLELKVPHDASIHALIQLYPAFISYVLSFLYLGIYWNNHHHMFMAVKEVDGLTLWANLHLLFWLSLLPFASGWMGENHFERLPTIFYGVILLMAAMAYALLEKVLTRDPDCNPDLARAIRDNHKGRRSMILYSAAIGLSFLSPWIGLGLYALVAAIWMIPDKRIEEQSEQNKEGSGHAADR